MRIHAVLTLLLLAAIPLSGCQSSQEEAQPAPSPAPPAEAAAAPPPGATDHSHEVIEPTSPAPSPAPAPAKAAPSKPQPATPEPARPAPEPAAPETVILAVPQGMQIQILLEDPLSSATSQPGDVFHAQVAEPVLIGGRQAIPAGSTVQGFVESAQSAAHWDKGGQIVLRFHLIQVPEGDAVPVVASLTAEGQSGTKGKKAAIIGGSAAGGAVLGKVLGKDNKDAVLGSIIGGAIGTGVVAGQKGDEVELPANTPLFIQIDETFEVVVPG